jgi:hypothetical protein
MPSVPRLWLDGLPDAPVAHLLAAVAAALGVRWDGPGAAVDLPLPELPELPDVPGWLLLDATREALVDRTARRRLGAHHTPPDLARRLAAIALDGLPPGAVVLDPACGGGSFLVAAADLLVAAGAAPEPVVSDQLRGIDVDPVAAATTRAALRCWAQARGADADPVVVVGDALTEQWDVDVVLGNPPFLSPLGADTGGGEAAARIRRELGAPYADVAGLFLARGVELVRRRGRVLLIQPESLLSSRDAAPVRAAAAAALEGMWIAGEPVFGASVRVCAPVLRRGTTAPKVRRWTGGAVRRVGAADRPGPGATWASLRPSSAPRVRPRVGPTLERIATATAGFRDEFYGLAASVTDDGPGHPVVTCGLIDPGRSAWGERPARIAGRRYLRPTVDPSALDGALAAWVGARLVPKVLVATQTKVVEALADPGGRFVPLTPVIAVVPHDPADVWRVTAALLSPEVSAWALHHHGGAALATDAIKLSARQVLAVPLPSDERAWAEAAGALEAGDVLACGAALSGGDDEVLTWWAARLPRPTPDRPVRQPRPRR